jgi:2-polyprenyl-6-methoxyphenol hydroxylase-like FAD-dependent oxidoreductase
MADLEVPVLIAGGSLVGMSTALLLAHQGVRPMVVEHHRGTAIHPRAAMIDQRTMAAWNRLCDPAQSSSSCKTAELSRWNRSRARNGGCSEGPVKGKVALACRAGIHLGLCAGR